MQNKTRWLAMAFPALLLNSLACAGEPTTQPAAEKPTATATQPADPNVMAILEKLEQSGQTFKNLRADIVHTTESSQLGTQEIRTGWVAYQPATKEAPAMFRIHFETLKQDNGPNVRQKVDYSFNGQWLTEAKHNIKTMTRYQLAADGEHIEPLRLGKGPFPLPFAQKADDVLEHFTVTTRPAVRTDPKNTVYLKLITRKEHLENMPFTKLEMWVNDKTWLPVRIRAVDKSGNTTDVEFKDIKTDVTLDKDTFHLKRPLGWEYRVEPLKRES